MSSPAPAAVRPFKHTETTTGSIAAVNATFVQGSEVNSVDLQNELMYQMTMSIARRMFSEGLMTEDEYRQIDTMFREKYHPKIGTLFVDLPAEQR